MARMRFKFKRPINAIGIALITALAIGVFNIPDKGGSNSPKYALSQWSKPAVIRRANADDSEGYNRIDLIIEYESLGGKKGVFDSRKLKKHLQRVRHAQE